MIRLYNSGTHREPPLDIRLGVDSETGQFVVEGWRSNMRDFQVRTSVEASAALAELLRKARETTSAKKALPRAESQESA